MKRSVVAILFLFCLLFVNAQVSDVVLSIKDNTLSNTTERMRLSLDTTNLGWTDTCNLGFTYFNFPDSGNYNVFIWDTAYVDSIRLIDYIPPQAIAPEYKVDYSTEKTDLPVAFGDVYSWHDDLSDSLPGNNDYVDLQVADTSMILYLFTSATDTTVRSDTLALFIKARPSPPSLSIDYVNEQSQNTYGDSLIIGKESLFLVNSSGGNSYVPLIPSDSLWLFYRYTSSNFISDTALFVVDPRPETPDVQIDYENEILYNVTGNYEWISTSGNKVLTDGYPISDSIPSALEDSITASIYLPEDIGSAFRSDTQNLVIPTRLAAPVMTGDDATDSIKWSYVDTFILATYYEYLVVGDASWTSCSSNPQYIGARDIDPGDLLLRIKAGTNNFAGEADTSTITYTAVGALDFSGVDVHIDNAKLTGTTTEMEFSLNSTDGLDGDWYSCVGSETSITVDSAGGFNVYVRNAADTTDHKLLAFIPAQGAEPTFAIDYINEQTDGLIPDTVEYAWLSDWSDKTDGPNVALDLNPVISNEDTVLYLRYKASQYRVASQAQPLNIPARPNIEFSIDYLQEKTNEIVPTDVDYSEYATMLSPSPGPGTNLDVTPGTDYWFRKDAQANTSFASDTFHLEVPARPDAPSYTVNYTAETTNESIPDTVEWDTQNSLLAAKDGTNTPLPLLPEIPYYFRIKNGNYNFESAVSEALNTPSRAEIQYTINHEAEETNEPVANDVWYANDSLLSGKEKGNGLTVLLSPGTDIWFRKDAVSGTSFASDTFHLVVPARPDIPEVDINYEFETVSNVPANAIWDATGVMTSVSNGASVSDFIPDSGQLAKTIYVEVEPTPDAFRSLQQELTIEPRAPAPKITEYEDIAEPNYFSFEGIDGFDSIDSFKEYEFDVNGNGWDKCNGFTEFVPSNVDIPAGSLQLRLKASEVNSRFSGVIQKSTKAFSGTLADDLSAVGIDIAGGLLTGTTSTMQYCLKADGATDSTWLNAVAGNTTADFDSTGGFKVYIRQADLTGNYSLVADVATFAPEPAYEIDYGTETLTTTVALGDEYSLNADMTGAIPGDGSTVVSLNPESTPKTLYLRTAATETAVASQIQSLTVEARPATPAVSIDYEAETVGNVPANAQWDATGVMTPVTEGESLNNYVPDNGLPAENIHVEVTYTDSTFMSLQQTLTLAPREAAPNITAYEDIAEPNSFTFTAISGHPGFEEYEYKYNSTDWTTCNDFTQSVPTNIPIDTGNLLVRLKADSIDYNFAGMEAASREAYSGNAADDLSAVGIDIAGGQITGTTDNMQYSMTSTDGMDGTWGNATNGTTTADFDSTGGFKVYIRQTDLHGNYSLLANVDVFASPPTYEIDYGTETLTTTVALGDEYSWNADMTGAIPGDGSTVVSLNPGSTPKTLYLRTAATATVVASEIQFLTVSPRPEAPSVDIDYETEALTFVPSNAQWNASGSWTNISNGTPVSIYVPDSGETTVVINTRLDSTTSSFKSEEQDITLLPRLGRPQFTGYDDISIQNTFTFTGITGYPDATQYEFKYNASTWQTCTDFVQDIPSNVAIDAGNLMLRLKASNTADYFAGMAAASTVDYSSTVPFSLTSVDVDVADRRILNTTEDMQYSLDSTDGIVGTWEDASDGFTAVNFDSVGNFKVYIRQDGLVGNYKLVSIVPPFDAEPTYGINFSAEKLQSPVATGDEYSWNLNMTDAVSGDGSTWPDLNPGASEKFLYIRTAATETSVASQIQKLKVPARPVTPETVIDYSAETIGNVPPNAQWDATGSMADLSSGTFLDTYIPDFGDSPKSIDILIPGTGTSFVSLQQTITLNPRPQKPNITSYDDVSDPNTFTWSPVGGFPDPEDYEYGYNYSGWIDCESFTESVPNDLYIPVGNLALRLRANDTESRFAGMNAYNDTEFSATVSIDLASVGIDIAAGLITGTTTGMEYSFNSSDGDNGDWSDAEDVNTPVSYNPAGGYDVYIRQKDLKENYRIVYSVAPQTAAPSYKVNYYTEQTETGIAIGDAYSWNEDLSDPVNGNGTRVALNPGSAEKILYIWTVATATEVASDVQELSIKSRPVVTDYTLDYVNVQTKQTIPSTVEWDDNSGFSSPTDGSGINLPVQPGQSYYFRIKATKTSFKSLVDEVAVPARPAIAYTLNYTAETTDEPVANGIIYDDNNSFSSPTNATGVPVPVNPGVNLFFKQVAVPGSSLASNVFELTVSGRPSSVSYSIDFVNERTTSTVPTNVEWSNQSDFADANSGTGSYVGLDASKTYYFRRKATLTSFASLPSNFTVPSRPTFTIGINYLIEHTDGPVPSNVMYDDNEGFTSPTNGTGSSIQLTPGTDLWFQQEAIPFTSYASPVYPLNVPDRPTLAPYTIDYFNETTKEPVPTTVQWSLAADMSDPNNGTGSVISIMPGTKYYFREKATTTKFKSSVSAPLEVPERADITFNIDYANERTIELVTSVYSWSLNSDMSGAVTGTGTYKALTPGQDIYFRRKAQDGVGYASNIYRLSVPDRPSQVSYELDYVNEQTKTGVPSTVEWSYQSNMSNPQSGNGNRLDVAPESNYYFRVKSSSSNFASVISPVLEVPSRPYINVTIDYVQEQTNQVIYSNTIYSTTSSMSSSIAGSGSAVTINPGQDLWFIKPAVPDVSLSSEKFFLDVKNRPVSPDFTIDYTNERTNEAVPATVEWSTHSDMSGATTGSGGRISLDPSTNYYFRTKATETTFASNVSSALVVPSRPDLNFTIDFFNERTNEVVETDIYWANNENMIGATQGNGSTLPLTPGTDIWFRKKAGPNRYASQVFHLIVPERPEIPSVAIDYESETVTNIPGYCQWDVTGSFTDVFNNASLTDYIPAYGNPGRNIVFRVKATTSSFQSGASVITVPARNQAPVIVFYNDITVPNTFTWNFIVGFINFSDYEYNINNTSWEPTTNITQEVPSDVQILAGDLLLRLAADNDDERFAGESYASTQTFTGTPPLDLGVVDLDLVAGEITGTTMEMEYSLNSTNGKNGTWETASNGATSITYDVTGDFKVYVRQADLTGNKRMVYDVAPQAGPPSYGIDYINETLDDPLDIADEMTWNSNLTGFSPGDGETEPELNISTSGTTAYIRTALSQYAVASQVQELDIPAREVLSYSINFINETTNQTVDTDVEWALSSDFTNYNVGTGAVITVIPDQDIWFKRRAHIDQFESAVYRLQVPARRIPIPSFTIDFSNEKTNEGIPDSIIYSSAPDMNGAVVGNSLKIDVTPGESIFFRTRASFGKFASDIFELSAPYRPDAPDPQIDYVNEGLINIEDACEWWMDDAWETISEGEDISALIPSSEESDNTVRVRYKATDNSFASPDKQVTIPKRIVPPEILTLDDEGDSVTWNTIDGYSDVTSYEYSLNNGNTWTMTESSTIVVGDVIIPAGEFLLRLSASNDTGNEHFSSDPAASESEFTAIALIEFDSVYIDIADGLLTGTNYAMEYSFTSTNGLNGDWFQAFDDTTFVDYPLDGGYAVYVRQKNKTQNFAAVYDVPEAGEAPDFAIDFYTEYLDRMVSDSIEISPSALMENAETGENSTYRIVPAKTDSFIYLRAIADSLKVPSRIQQIYIPARPDAPLFTINYSSETTNEIVGDSIEYADNTQMVYAETGVGTRLQLAPSSEIDTFYFRILATDTSFKSDKFVFILPPRPLMPDVRINYLEELIYNVPSECQWNMNGDFEPVNDSIPLESIIPPSDQEGRSIDFKILSTDTTFESHVTSVTVDSRSPAPEFTAYNDVFDTFTFEPVEGVDEPEAYEYSLNNGVEWMAIDAFTVKIGNVNLDEGAIKLRVKADNDAQRFKGDVAISEEAFTYTDLLSFEVVNVNLITARLNGTTAEMQYSILNAGSNDTIWTDCAGGSTDISYPQEGDFRILMRQIGREYNQDMILYVEPPEKGPEYQIDYYNEQLAGPVSSEDEYATQADMSDAVKGDNVTVLQFFPDQSDSVIYFRIVGTETTLPSNVTELIIPSRPDLNMDIDFEAEETQKPVNNAMIWWTEPDMSDSVRGENEPVPVQPNDVIWFLQYATDTSFKSFVDTIKAPDRLDAPQFTIDFYNETTVEIASDDIIWSFDPEFANSNRAANDVIPLSPGKDTWLAVAATDTSFMSHSYVLEVPIRPDRPDKPVINYADEQLVDLSANMEIIFGDEVYHLDTDWFDLNNVIKDDEFVTIEVRIESDGEHYFASESQVVVIPERPDLPYVTLEHLVSDKGALYVNNRKARASDGMEYRIDNGDWVTIDDNTTIEIGGDRVIVARLASTSNTFRSEPSENLNFKLDAQLIDLIVVDGLHDSRLVIGGLQHFPDNRIQIFTRWGNMIYEVDNYQNEFDFATYPAGTYYYVVSYTDEGERKVFTNFVEVIKK